MELPKKKEYSKEDGMGYLYYQSDKEYTNAWNDCHEQYTKAIIERLEKIGKCSGCGSIKSMEQLESEGFLSCCPERDVPELDQLIKELKDA